ncbi:DNA helicase-2/ATP-dependent DNA helicase PcrA [Chitinophaga sp. S165]|nr:DNA helicase-2/ATP-dependent DNA helicase PcrA [Chitinophaga sp. S165]
MAEQKAKPEGIVAFTFTEKAADSIKLRVAGALQKCGIDPNVLGRMYIGTIHSYCQHLLGQIDARYRQFEVLDDNRLKLYLISRYPQLGCHKVRDAKGARYFQAIDELSHAWSVHNEEMLSINDIKIHDPIIGEFLEVLKAALDRDGFMDFSSMQRIVVDRLEAGSLNALSAISDLEHLLVDEYQDINPVQDRLISKLRESSKTLFVVGDDDQSIYGFRGADVTRILTFGTRYPNAASHTLNVNYRSTEAIVSSANAFACQELGATRLSKAPTALTKTGTRDYRVLWFDERPDETEWVVSKINELLGTEYHESDGQGGVKVRGLTPADFAILMYSTGGDEQDGTSRHTAFTNLLEQAGIPYTLESGGGIFRQPHVLALKESFLLLRDGNPDRTMAKVCFDQFVLPAYPIADFQKFAKTLNDWGHKVHGPTEASRRRVFPQNLVYDLLDAFNLKTLSLSDVTMLGIGVFSRIIQDVEAVFVSVDSQRRFTEILNFLENVAESGYEASTYEIVLRPDAVTVSTVHKMKGLEFPVVFVVDVEKGRFPGNRGSYNGWLPHALLNGSIGKGAYCNTPEQYARLFYTAITRSERYLYVTGSKLLPGGRQTKKEYYTLRLNHNEISRDTNGSITNLKKCQPERRLDESNLPTSYSDVKYYLNCPKNYQFRKAYGFSPPITEMFGFGMSVHAAVGKLHEVYRGSAPAEQQAQDIAKDLFHLKHVYPSKDPISSPGPYERAKNRAAEVVGNYAKNFASDFESKRQVEARFEIPLKDAVISGAIDLMIEQNTKGEIVDACVVDFKTIEGGEDPHTNDKLDWENLSLQVQLYARAAKDVLGKIAKAGYVHLLKDGKRIAIPVNDMALDAAIKNLEWAARGIINEDFPMRPHPQKCETCDFNKICSKTPQNFKTRTQPPPLHIPEGGPMMVGAFNLYKSN